MRIIPGDEPIPVDHPVVCLYGQPGIGKTTLGYSAKDPLLLDFDQGAHRAANRRATAVIESWADVRDVSDSLAPYATVVVDTVGRLLDLLSADIIETNPKMGRDGALTLQGFGTLKARFRAWMTQLRLNGKDVLLLAHHREEKDNDATIMRPDIQGASYGEVMKTADVVGFLYMRGKDRVLDFNPTDRWHGKNPGGWKPFIVPPVAKAQTVMAEIFDQARAALGHISEESAQIMRNVEDWRTAIAGFTTCEECTKAVTEINKLPAIAMAQVKPILAARAKALQFTYNTSSKTFVNVKQMAGV